MRTATPALPAALPVALSAAPFALVTLSLAGLPLLGCAGGKPNPDPVTDDSEPTIVDDTAPPSFDPTTDCDTLGMPSVPFVDAEPSAKIYDFAADLTLQTTDGEWNLKQGWSGCDAYLFIPDAPAQNQGVDYETWSKKKDNKALVDVLPLNTHVFFLSSDRADEDRQLALDELKDSIDDQLAEYDAETRAWKERHIHYVTDKSTKAESWLGDTLSSPNWGVGIDRTQRLRYIGSMADPERYNGEWFDSNLSLVANEAVYYNYEATRQAALDAEDATLVPAWTGEDVYGGADIDITLPDAATMATFDKLELDMTKLCVGDGEYTECPAWDYLDYVYLCDEADPDSCPTELGRWITTYHREGRWITDVSPLLGLLKAGGTRRLRIHNSNQYLTTLTLRLSDTGATDRPSEAQLLYTTGHVSSTYNDREPLTIDIPDDVSRVGIGVVMTGHGNPGCMEFCGTEHNFSVNGSDNLFTYALGDQTWGCMDQIEQGTVPNQYGTWWYARNGWCPGKQVDMQFVDVTDQVLFGQTNSFDYEMTPLDGSLESGGDIVLSTWLVYYR